MHLDEKSSPVTIPEAEISTRKIEKEAKVSFLDIWQHFGVSLGAVARLETSVHEYLIVVGPWTEVLIYYHCGFRLFFYLFFFYLHFLPAARI